jgi:radical SAM superfamily enzyme YgiQ (UPF0313 family)
LKVFLLAPPWSEIYGSFRAAAKVAVAYPPLGLCYLASSLRAAGHEALVVDAEAEGLDLAGVLERLERFGPDLLGIQVVSPLWDIVLEVCRAVKARGGLPIVLGGPHITITRGEAFEQNPHFDYAVIGEGEETLAELAGALQAGVDPSHVAGLCYRREGALHATAPRPSDRELDSVPVPERGDLRMSAYRFSVPGRGLQPFATLTSTRGCPFECTFCTEPMMFGRRTRFRTPGLVVDEIEDTWRRYGTTHFIFVDDTLTVEKKRMREICRQIVARGLPVTMEGWTHANTVDAALLTEMRAAGFVRLSFGVESGDPAILKSLKKGTDHERLRAAYRAAKGAGIETRGSVILGLPGDTRETVERTIRFVCELADLDHCYFNLAMPYPGTEIRELALRGERGTRLLSREYSVLRRQGQSVVMEVNDLDTRALLRLQRRAYRAFWLRPRRVLYNLTRAGWRAGLTNAWAFFESFILPSRTLRPRTRFVSEITAVAERAAVRDAHA